MFYFSVTWNRSEKCTEKRTGMKTLLFLVRWVAELSQEERIILKKKVLFSEIWPQSPPARFKTPSIFTSIFKTQISTIIAKQVGVQLLPIISFIFLSLIVGLCGKSPVCFADRW